MIAIWLAIFILSLVALSGWYFAVSNRRKLVELHEQIEAQTASLKQELASVSSGAVGVGQTLLNIEKKLNNTIEQQQQMVVEHDQFGYEHAANLADEGADAAALSQRYGLPDAEAELVALLRGKPAVVTTDSKQEGSV